MEPRPHARNTLLILISYLAFISLGLPDGLLGIGWPFMSAKLNVPLDALGILLAAFVAGYLSTSTTSGKILLFVPLGMLLALSCLTTGLSLLAYAYSGHWFLTIIASFFLGSGGGAIDTSINVFAAHRFSPSVVNWLHGFYGIGATSGPFIMTWLFMQDKAWYHGYIAVGIIQLLLAVVFLATARYWKVSSGSSGPTPAGSYAEALRISVVWIQILIFFLYTGIEFSVAQWMFTVLTEARDLSDETAGLWTGAYWGSFTTGRIIFGIILKRIRVQDVLISAFLGLVVGTVLLVVGKAGMLTLAGIVIVGFACAPIFPSLISLTPKTVGERHSANVIGFQVSAAMIGGALIPGFAGLMTDYFGWEVIPVLYVLEAALLAVLYFVSTRMTPVVPPQ